MTIQEKLQIQQFIEPIRTIYPLVEEGFNDLSQIPKFTLLSWERDCIKLINKVDLYANEPLLLDIYATILSALDKTNEALTIRVFLLDSSPDEITLYNYMIALLDSNKIEEFESAIIANSGQAKTLFFWIPMLSVGFFNSEDHERIMIKGMFAPDLDFKQNGIDRLLQLEKTRADEQMSFVPRFQEHYLAALSRLEKQDFNRLPQEHSIELLLTLAGSSRLVSKENEWSMITILVDLLSRYHKHFGSIKHVRLPDNLIQSIQNGQAMELSL